MPKTGIEPAQDIILHAPKACASASSATSAEKLLYFTLRLSILEDETDFSGRIQVFGMGINGKICNSYRNILCYTNMKVIRWLLVLFLSFFLWLIIFVGIPVGALTHLVSTPERVKLFIEESEIYDNMGDILSEVVPLMFLSTGGDAVSTVQGESQDGDSEIAVLIEEILTPEFLRTNIEKSVDSLYGWLRGETEYPEIEINLAEDKEKITQIMVLSLSGTIKALPACTGDTVSLETVDPFTMECIPTGFNVESFEEELEEGLLEELKVGGQADEVLNQFIFKTKPEDFNSELTQTARSIFSLVTFAPILILSAITFLLLLIVLLIPNAKSRFVFPGVLLILASFPASISKIVVTLNIKNILALNTFSPVFSEALGPILDNILGRISVVGCIILSTGVALIVIRIVMKPKSKDQAVEKKPVKKEKEEKIESKGKEIKNKEVKEETESEKDKE